MLKQIAEFIDYDVDRFSEGDILTEFDHKYRGSYIKLNNTLGKFIKFTLGKGIYFRNSTTGIESIVKHIDSIEAYHPKTGLYMNKGSLVYLHRMPNRQWIKSFSPGNNYTAYWLSFGDIEDVATLLSNPDTEYAEESIIHNNKIYLLWKEVGVANTAARNIHLYNDTFIEEIRELWKQYRVTLDAPPQQKPMDENLIVDFL